MTKPKDPIAGDPVPTRVTRRTTRKSVKPIDQRDETSTITTPETTNATLINNHGVNVENLGEDNIVTPTNRYYTRSKKNLAKIASAEKAAAGPTFERNLKGKSKARSVSEGTIGKNINASLASSNFTNNRSIKLTHYPSPNQLQKAIEMARQPPPAKKAKVSLGNGTPQPRSKRQDTLLRRSFHNQDGSLRSVSGEATPKIQRPRSMSNEGFSNGHEQAIPRVSNFQESNVRGSLGSGDDGSHNSVNGKVTFNNAKEVTLRYDGNNNQPINVGHFPKKPNNHPSGKLPKTSGKGEMIGGGLNRKRHLESGGDPDDTLSEDSDAENARGNSSVSPGKQRRITIGNPNEVREYRQTWFPMQGHAGFTHTPVSQPEVGNIHGASPKKRQLNTFRNDSGLGARSVSQPEFGSVLEGFSYQDQSQFNNFPDGIGSGSGLVSLSEFSNIHEELPNYGQSSMFRINFGLGSRAFSQPGTNNLYEPFPNQGQSHSNMFRNDFGLGSRSVSQSGFNNLDEAFTNQGQTQSNMPRNGFGLGARSVSQPGFSNVHEAFLNQAQPSMFRNDFSFGSRSVSGPAFGNPNYTFPSLAQPTTLHNAQEVPLPQFPRPVNVGVYPSNIDPELLIRDDEIAGRRPPRVDKIWFTPSPFRVRISSKNILFQACITDLFIEEARPIQARRGR